MRMSATGCLLLAAGIWLGISTPCRAEQELQRFQAAQPHMGTSFKYVFYAPDERTADRVLAAVARRVEELEQSMSDYRSDSEVNVLCQSAGGGRPVVVSPDLLEVMLRSQQISRQTGGMFDVTVGPLTKLWRRARRRKAMPAEDLLEQARAAVGFQHVVIDPSRSAILLDRPNMRIDLGGIAKGFAADQAQRTFAAHGVDRCLVNAGGDLALAEPPPGQPGWQVGIAPLQPDGPPTRTLRLSKCGIATSGDAWQFVQLDGKRYSHIINPLTGLPTTQRISVTVIARDCTTADGYASAISVLGDRLGLDTIARLPDVEALVVTADDAGVHTRVSPGFPAATETE